MEFSRDNIEIGDKVEFKINIAYRPHRSRSLVYGFTKLGPLITCNGIRHTFQLRWDEIIKVTKANTIA